MNKDNYLSKNSPKEVPGRSLHGYFSQTARRNPAAIALISGSESMTYAELDDRSNRLARQLLHLGLQTEDFVAIYLDRSFEMIVAIFAILKAGGAYLPIDVNYPADRIAFMLEDGRVKVLLTQSSRMEGIPAAQARIVCLDKPETQISEVPDAPFPTNPVSPKNLAYMIYTSGSTGRPKGCMITHENVLYQLEGQQAIAPQPIGKMILTVSIGFDVSVLTIFWTLLQGATLVLPKQGEEKDPLKLAEIIYENKVTHSMTLPSPYTLLLDHAPAKMLQSLRLVNVSGEVCPSSLAQKHGQLLPDCQLFNLYGPTEATVNCTFFKFPKGFNEPKVPIGIPLPNYEIFILNDKKQEIPAGDTGEIYIGGSKPVVGRGYWNRPELTSEKFIRWKASSSDPGEPAQLLYKTGDLARRLPDGNIEFLGRADFQVKYRGFRIELGEIETAVSQHPAVNESVVLLREGPEAGEQRLVAYVTLKFGKTSSIGQLRTFLQKTLPEYMLPSHLVIMEKMPLTTNGKFDRQALPEPTGSRPTLEEPYEPSHSRLEKYIVEKWERLLQIAPVGRSDKFFELGGNSILAARFIGEMMGATGESIFITTMFDYPTPAAYASFLEKNYPLFQAPHDDTSTSGLPDKVSHPTISSSKITTEDIAHFTSLIPGHLPSRQPALSHSSAAATADTQAQIVFILAPPRSGTTLLRVMLAGHPELFACNELQLFHFETLQERNKAYSGRFSLWSEGLIRAVMQLRSLDADQAKLLLLQLADQGMTTSGMVHTLYGWLNSLPGAGFRNIVDKSPSYALDPAALEKALADFPNARFIHLVRHPYSMVRSFEKYHIDQVLYLRDNDYSSRQLGELVWLHSHRNVLNFLKKVPADRQFRMSYEELVKNPESVMRQMCQAVGLPFHPDLLRPYQNLDKKMTSGIYHESRSMGDTHFDQKKKIDPEKAEDWKGVLKDNFLSEKTWELAQELNYSSPGSQPPCQTDLPRAGSHKKQSAESTAQDSSVSNLQPPDPASPSGIAIIGMACRLPGANNLEEFWQNLVEAREVGRDLTSEDLAAEGIAKGETPAVKRTYAMAEPYAFDATFFGYHPKEAELTDPQHRIFLETAYEALESAGYDPFRFEGNIGIFGGVARNTYFTNNILTNKKLREDVAGWYQDMLTTDSTFSISRVAYKLNLRGPAVNVQTACSTGGVAVHLACQSLYSGDSDMVIVGGGRVQPPVFGGYEYTEGGPLSPDGICRAFDEKANGMVQGHGMAMLVLKKLDKALQDGDHVWAVIKSTALNNDGAAKTGITAPSAKGQAAVMRKALEKAHLKPGQISYIEAHGTGTFIGDPIEIQGIEEARREEGAAPGRTPSPLLIGSVKTNIGHLDAGAGIVGIIKTALALYYEQLPATLHFNRPNPQINFKNSGIEVNATLRPWKRSETPRRAGVSSFGLGGTNAHIILEEAPQAPIPRPEEQDALPLLRPSLPILLSAKTEQALQKQTTRLFSFLEKKPGAQLADVTYTLALGRPHFSRRKAIAGFGAPGKPIEMAGTSDFHAAPVVFMFPGGGAQYPNMSRGLYQTQVFFKEQVDNCLEILEKRHGLKIREILFPKASATEQEKAIEEPLVALTALFTIEYATAQLWQHWGIQPSQLIGHSMGEYTAACLAGVMSLEDALGLVAVRGRLFETLEGNGCMLSVPLTEEDTRPYLDSGHTISVINKPDSLVVSGTAAAIDRLQQRLSHKGVETSLIHIRVAAHSPQVDPILPEFKKYLETVKLQAPQIPIVSNVTGTWLTAAEATSPDYWLRHLRQPVNFARGLQTLLGEEGEQVLNKKRIFLEVGPGQTLSTFARAIPTLRQGMADAALVAASLRHPKEPQDDLAFIYKTLAKLWVNGLEPNWQAVYENQNRRRIPLPSYPFEKRKYFIASARQLQSRQPATVEVALPPVPAFFPKDEQLEEQKSDSKNMKDPISRLAVLTNEIKQSLYELSGLAPENMDEHASFLELGFDSLFLSQVVIKFNHKFKLKLSFRMLFEDLPTIAALAAYMDGELPPGLFRPAPAADSAGEQRQLPADFNSGQMLPLQIPGSLEPGEGSPVVQQIIQQQLQLMQQQLSLLQSGGGAQPQQGSTTQQVLSARSAATAESLRREIAKPAGPTADSQIHRSVKGVTAKLNSYKKIASDGMLTGEQLSSLREFMQRYAAMTQKSKELAQRHRQWYADPRSVTGFSRLWKEICYQIAHERSQGSKIWDVDGNEYVDYVMSYGVALFGHAPDFVQEAVAAAIRRGNSIDLLPPQATEVARIICELTGHDRATLANTGTEAVLGAVRAARTSTGREKIAVFDTDYHGMIDQFMVRGVHLKGESKTLPSSPGIPQFLVENTLVLDYDDPEVLQKLEAHIGELAAVVIEPVQAQNPHWQHRELIHAVRQLTREHGVALIFDEIINGFRLHQHGAQAWYGVEADLCAYGKSISGGLPLAAVAGKARFMEAFDGGMWSFGDDSSPESVITYFASTFIKNPISVAAAHAALLEIQRLGPALQQGLNEKAIRFAERIREIFLRTKAPLMIQACSSFFMIKNADSNPLTRLFNYFLRARGVNIRERPCFISTAHTEEDFEKTYQAFELAIADMFEAGLLEPWEGEDLSVIVPLPTQEKESEVFTKIEKRAWENLPLAESQQEIFLSNYISSNASKAYNIATEIRLEGAFDTENMRKALQTLVDRNEALRTVFAEDGLRQTVLPDLQVEVPFVDLSEAASPELELQRLHAEEAEHLFDLQKGPLVRFKILRLQEQVHLVFIHVHHIICDGWSLGILTRELGVIYSQASAFQKSVPAAPAKQLSQYVMEQAALGAAEEEDSTFQKNEKYWLSQFTGEIPLLNLPADFARPAVRSFGGAMEKISLAAGFVSQLRKAAARQSTTFYVFMLAAYQAYLSRITGQEDMVVGVAAAGHNLPGNERLVAHAIGMLPLRTKIDVGHNFSAYLKTVRSQVLDAFDHQEYTFGTLVKKLKIERSASRNTLLSVAFNLDSPLDDLDFGSLKATTCAIPRHYETFDIFINLKPLSDGVDFEWNYNTDLFRPESIRLRLAEFERFLHGLVEDTETPIARLPLLPDFERKQLAAFGQGEKADFPLHRRLHELFAEQAAKTPEKVALIFEHQSLTYREIDEGSTRLAQILLQKGLPVGGRVCLCVERSPEMILSIYAILKAGGTYVPVDPYYPPERIRFVLEDAGCSLLLTQRRIAGKLPAFGGEILFVDETNGLESGHLVAEKLPEFSSDTLAYILYTSGSTGTPKGVAVTQKSVVNGLYSFDKQLNVSGEDRHYSVSSMTFDISVLDFFLPLMKGATLILASEEVKKDGFALRESLALHRPSLMQATPATWRILMLAGWEGDAALRALAGGEGLSKELATEMIACCKEVWNGYGPTEATIYTSFQKVTAEHLSACPGEYAAIGRPLANVELLILDKNGEQVPRGIPGELFIGGAGVAQGYLHRPELTERAFVADARRQKRYYRSGDLVRYLPDGELEFLGRMDNQVKIRGFRVEPGEIEEVIKRFPAVANAAVTVFVDKTGSTQLAGYVVPVAGTRFSEAPDGGNWEELKSFLRSKLPGFMVPVVFIELDEMPLSTSLKVDRKALPKPDLLHLASKEFEPPKTPGEKLLANIWQELLGVERVGIYDDFFELGGHSLAAVQMMSKLKAATGVKLPLSSLFRNSTVQKLALQLNGFDKKKQKKEQEAQHMEDLNFSSLIPIREQGTKPSLYLVHGGGLHVLFYQNLVKYLDKDQPIFALQARGLDGSEEPLDRIEDMAAFYLREILMQNPQGPYCLAGYSLGGLIAWEMTRQLKDMGKEVLLLSLFDTVAKYEWAGSGTGSKWKKRLKKTGFNLSFLLRNPTSAVEYKKHVLKMNLQQHKGKLRIAYRNKNTNEIEEGYLPFSKEVYDKSMEAYDKYKLQPLDIQVDLFRAKEKVFYLDDAEFYGWNRFALQGVIVHEIEGNHLTLFDEPHGQEVAQALKKRLEEVGKEALVS